MRILGVDPGDKNIGIAISDPTGTIANPLTVLKHRSRAEDAQAIVDLAIQNEAGLIIIGQNLDEEGMPTFQGRKSARLGGVIKGNTEIPVRYWDESGSTKTARQARIAMDVSRSKRSGHLDELAATVILQSYLIYNSPNSEDANLK
ncbi:MAG: Holliday junction resolvase RuvX [Anaerolineales bacterium]|nr:Holliday junction resolvase RuvX [Chloroflexota bacterium]MBL6981789.1 Holliday junction resolvase RuvX [Anaerolineales bacterium]